MASSAGADFGVIVGLAGALIGLLYLLLQIAKKQDAKMKEAIKNAKQMRRKTSDKFRVQNGWSWDYVMVFEVREEGEELNDFQRQHSMRWILSRLAAGGLQTKMFYSIQHDEVFCKVRAAKERLEKEADRIDYKLPLEPTALERTLDRGKPDVWAPIRIVDEHDECEFEPYDHIYAKYEYGRDDVAHLYKVWGEHASVFRGVDRLKLIYSIIAARTYDGGCHLDVNKLKKEKCILGFFPLHDRVELLELEAKWLVFCQRPDRQPVDDVKDYFGEKIGLYFAWLGHYCTWLIIPAIVGFFAWINVAADGNNPDTETIPYFSVFVAVWSTLYLESWKRNEATYALKWGMTGFEEEEQPRPQFDGIPGKSPIDGSEYLYFPRSERARALCKSQTTIFGLILVVAAAVSSIFVLKWFLLQSPQDENVAVGGSPMGGIIASLLNAVLIQVMNIVYGTVAIKLNDMENHRTDTEYEDSLIAKTFMFQFVNSYSSLFYIGFAKESFDGCEESCMSELQTALGTIFLTRLAVGNVTEVGVPYINSVKRAKAESEGVDEDVEHTQVEEEYLQEEYDVLLGTFGDFAEMAIQFGYATLFVAAFPLAFVMSFVNNYIEIRVDAWKICQQSRRPEPRSAEDIGTWQTILEIMSVIAVINNCALITFTGTLMADQDALTRVWLFIVMEHTLLIAKYGLAVIVPDIPADVEIQLKRQDHFVSKVIDNAQDEGDEDLVADISVEMDLTIRVTDDDPN